ncbi:MAG TPA: class I SAM-dependent methyltransferase [Prosthecobacter sp.]
MRTASSTHGRGTCGALGWRTEESQTRRFEVLAEIADRNDHTVLDVGCGHGDLRAHLGGKFPSVHYTGLDHQAALLDVALKRYGGWPQTTFFLGDFCTAALPPSEQCARLRFHQAGRKSKNSAGNQLVGLQMSHVI